MIGNSWKDIFPMQMQCDLLQEGLAPGVNKCSWDPRVIIEWNGLKFNFDENIYLSWTTE
jgi:hypothetical protein